jgi:hypothetical protein
VGFFFFEGLIVGLLKGVFSAEAASVVHSFEMWQAIGGVVGFYAASASVTTDADGCCEMWQANRGVVGFHAASASVTTDADGC